MKTKTCEENRTMRYEFRRLGDGRKAILRETRRAVTPFGGLAVLAEFWRELGLLGAVRQRLPFTYTSPNSIGAAEILLAFWLSVTAGARRFAHVNLVRSDVALRQLLGWRRWPGDDAVRAFFGRFGWKEIEAFFPALTQWLLARLCPQAVTLDLDSTVFERFGRQEGAKRGYHPRKPGRPSHHPILAVLAEPVLVLHGWLRSGNTSAGRGAVAFLTEALALLPAGWRVRTVRADSGFFDGQLLDFLEARQLPYVIVARLTPSLKHLAAGLQTWRELDADYAVSEFHAQLLGWSCARRFVVVRERVRENKAAVGRRLLAVPGYTYRLFVTNRDPTPEELWRDYNLRATIEQRIGELKDDLAADDFCRRGFFATEAAFRAVLTLFNLLSLWQTAARPPAHTYRRPATLRTEVFLCGAIAGTSGRTPVLHLSQSWGGLTHRIPLIEQSLRWCRAIPPRLEKTPASAATPIPKSTADPTQN
jgi:hypothetical protein